jgi:hypothetical protein
LRLLGFRSFPVIQSAALQPAQWAARCGASHEAIRDVGRWQDIRRMVFYLAEGKAKRKNKIEIHGGRDPILDFWVFNSDAPVTSMDAHTSTLDD